MVRRLLSKCSWFDPRKLTGVCNGGHLSTAVHIVGRQRIGYKHETSVERQSMPTPLSLSAFCEVRVACGFGRELVAFRLEVLLYLQQQAVPADTRTNSTPTPPALRSVLRILEQRHMACTHRRSVARTLLPKNVPAVRKGHNLSGSMRLMIHSIQILDMIREVGGQFPPLLVAQDIYSYANGVLYHGAITYF